jgi:hypothetical protein
MSGPHDDALPHCGRCHPRLPNLATRLDEQVWWCSRCGRMWTPETDTDYQPERTGSGELLAALDLDEWEAFLLLRVCDQSAREMEAAGQALPERLLHLRDKLAYVLGRLRAMEGALRRQQAEHREPPL